MQPTNVFILEVTEANYNRYFKDLLNYLEDSDRSSLNLYLIKLPWLNASKLDAVFQKLNIEIVLPKDLVKSLTGNCVLLNAGFRLPDIYYTYLFKKRNFKVYQLQHGIYTERFPKSIAGFLKGWRRKFNYFKFLVKLISIDIPYGCRNVKKALYKDFIFFQKDSRCFESVYCPDVVFTWNADSFNFYVNINNYYSVKYTRFIAVGSFDSWKFSKLIFYPNCHSFCYIAQTLVEDGRMSRIMFSKVLDKLVTLAKSSSFILFVKLHPRSDKTLYNRLLILENVQLTDGIPFSNAYFGHYSALLYFIMDMKIPINLIHLDNHYIPKDLIKKSAKVFNIDDNLTPVWNQNSDPGSFGTPKNPFTAVWRNILGEM